MYKEEQHNQKVVGGENHFAVLKSDGTVWTYGYNGNGQLGLGDTTNRTEPTKVNIENVIDITAGYQYTAILKMMEQYGQPDIVDMEHQEQTQQHQKNSDKYQI